MINADHVMAVPRVVPILWGQVYADNPTAVKSISDLLSDLVTGPFMNGMVQYGVRRGTVQAPIVIKDRNPPKNIVYFDVNNRLQDDITKQLNVWIAAGLVPAPPSPNDTNQLYLIIPSPSSAFQTFNGAPSATSPGDPTGLGVQGYHNEGVTNPGSPPTIYWAIVQTNFVNSWSNGPISSKNFVSLGVAPTIAHELAEQFVDRNGTYQEIGDKCNNNSVEYRGWSIQQYLSVWDGNGCINGDSPVSVRAFMKAIRRDPSKGLRALDAAKINLSFIATSMLQVATEAASFPQRLGQVRSSWCWCRPKCCSTATRERSHPFNVLITEAGDPGIDYVLLWKSNRFAHSARHLLSVKTGMST